MTLKACTSCCQAKPFAGFYPHPAGRDGFMSKCRDCHKRDVRERRRLNDAVRDYDRQRGNRQDADYTRAYRATNPEAYAAHTAVGNALRDGRLKREPCLFCTEVKVQAHHRDYSLPLDVVWLCSKCHRRLHAYFPETEAHERTLASLAKAA